MRVLQFSDSFLPVMDGVGNVVYQYAVNLGLRGHESYVVAPQTDTGYRGNFPFEIVDYTGVPLPKLKSYKVGTPVLDAHCKRRLATIQADIVHVHSPFTAGQAGISYAQKRGCPIVGTFHSKYYDDFLQVTGIELLAEVGVKYVVSFYEKCDEVWAVSASSADTLRSYGYTGSVRIMPNGTDIHPVEDAAAHAVWERYGLMGETPVLLYVGQINWKKNLRHILEACAKLERPFQLVMAGQGPHEKEVRQLANSLGIGDQTLLTGHITDSVTLNALYRRADLFLFPSIYDNSPLVVREAAAMGTPAVVTRGSSAAECVTDGENGFLCQDDAADIARIIDGALADPEALERVGQRARDTIPVPWARLMDDVLEVYGQLIKAHSKGKGA
ncbi:MAG: glycosyltransferase [Clostridia bacterium]|nr:glycosyltransferase [Clostridia bacterium]